MESLILLAPPWVQTLVGWFTSGEGRLTAAAMLWVVFLVLKKAPKLGDWIESKLPTKMQKRTVVLILAMLPAAIGGLVSDVPLKELVITGLLAFGGSLGWNSVITEFAPSLGGRKDNPLLKLAEQMILQGAAAHKLDKAKQAVIDEQAADVEASAAASTPIDTEKPQ